MIHFPLIPGYECLQYLGGGQMTCVFVARELETGTEYAIKVVRDDWEDPDTAVKLLQREARAGLQVRHAHLVRIEESHVTRPPFFIVMQLLAGESLRRRMQRTYRLCQEEVLWIVRQTAQALSVLHRQGFIHGDIKPENIHIVSDGTAVLIDLGFAHHPGENATLLGHGYVLGTPNYLAPELCGADEADDADDFKSDVFSLGTVLFEMLTGVFPFPSGSLQQTLRRHQCDPPKDIRRLAANLHPDLAALVVRMLAHRPEQRPTANAVVQQLVELEIASLRRAA